MEIKKAVKYQVTCPHCGSEITFTLGEIDFSNKPFHVGGWVTCPHCGCDIQTHEYWYSSDRFELIQSRVITIFDDKVFEYRKLFEPDPEKEKAIKKLLEKDKGDE